MTTTWYSTRQVAQRLNVPISTVQHFIRAGVLGAAVQNPAAKRRIYRVGDHHLRAYQRATERAARRAA